MVSATRTLRSAGSAQCIYMSATSETVLNKEMKVGWLGRLFGAVPKEEMEGIRLDTAGSYWEIDGFRTFVELFNALEGWLPEGAVLYFEGGSPDAEIDSTIRIRSTGSTSTPAF